MVLCRHVRTEDSSSQDELRDDDPLLRAVARAPQVRAQLAGIELPEALREAMRRSRDPGPTGAGWGGDPSQLPEPGTVVDGRYRIDARLGAGGMGVVFEATHLQTHKSVALKWMHSGSALRSDSERVAARRRFEREARIAARVRHPNLVDVQDASSDEGRSYLVMERLRGETLGARMKRGVLAWDELLGVLVPTLRGVAALHREGVIHRDLKPENIFLEQASHGGELCPKVLDFGVAALREAELVSDETLTRPGSVLGTPGYMPLEQLRGERALDAGTDVYALGVVAYEALCGQRPFRAGNAAEHAALLASTSPAALGERVPALRGARSDAVMRALARDPRDRHESVEAFSAALVGARQTPPGRRRRVLLAALLLLALAGWLFVRATEKVVSHVSPTVGRHAASREPLPRVVSPLPPVVAPAASTLPVAGEPAGRASEPPRSPQDNVVVEVAPSAPSARAARPRPAAAESSRKPSSARQPAAPAASPDRAMQLRQDDF